MTTKFPAQESVQESWFLIDADNQILGRLASRVAALIRGKNSSEFSPHVNPRNHVIVINAQKIRVTGDKLKKKTYYRHSGHPGGLKAITLEKLMQKNAGEALRKAVRGMLPKNRLGSRLNKCLRVYSGPEHEHAAQKPRTIALN